MEGSGCARVFRQTRREETRVLPWPFLGFGFLYAWGYALWETPAFGTLAFSDGGFDPSWLTSAITVPIALLVLALMGFGVQSRDLRGAIQGMERSALPVALMVCLGVAGTLLSVAYPALSGPLPTVVAVASGLCTGAASALASVLWGLALSHLAQASLETVVPLSFVVSALCSLLVPALPRGSAVVVALMMLGAGALLLMRARNDIQRGMPGDPCGSDGVSEFDRSSARAPIVVARALLYGVVAWALCSALPGLYTSGTAPTLLGIDVVSVAGFLFAIAYAFVIIRFAVRVDFQALSSMTLPLFALALLLCAVDNAFAQTCAQILGVALGVCFEIVIMLLFIHMGQSDPKRRMFWISIGSASGYAGVLLGSLVAPLLQTVGDRSLCCLAMMCAYTLAATLVPQRLPYRMIAVQPVREVAPREQGAPAVLAARTIPVTRVAEETPADQTVSGAGVATVPDPSGAANADGGIEAACDALAREFGLSAREREVCGYLARGRSQTYIRDALFLSKNTVATHVRRLYAKLDVHSRQELIDLVESRGR